MLPQVPDHIGTAIMKFHATTTIVVLLKGSYLPPPDLRCYLLFTAYTSKLGIEKCKQRAWDVLYWPRMSTKIKDGILYRTVIFMLYHTQKNLSPNFLAAVLWKWLNFCPPTLNFHPLITLHTGDTGHVTSDTRPSRCSHARLKSWKWPGDEVNSYVSTIPI